MKYQITLTAEQLYLVEKATACYARLIAGQPDIALEQIRIPLTDQREAEGLMVHLADVINRMGEGWKSQEANQTYVIHEAARHARYLAMPPEDRAYLRSTNMAYPPTSLDAPTITPLEPQ